MGSSGAFAVFSLSDGGGMKCFVEELAWLNVLFKVGLAQFFLLELRCRSFLLGPRSFCLSGGECVVELAWSTLLFNVGLACAVFCWVCVAIGVSCWAITVLGGLFGTENVLLSSRA